MSDSLVATKRRIQTIQSTEKITKAMKLVASVKYQKWRKMYEANKGYTQGMEEVMNITVDSIDFSKIKTPACLQHFSDTKNLYIIVTSSLGLCGSYNYNIFRMIDPLLKPDDELLLIGQKGYIHYKESKYIHHDDYLSLMDQFTYNNVKAMRHYFYRLYRTQLYKTVTLVYTEYRNSLSFVTTMKQLLPLDIDKKKIISSQDDDDVTSYDDEMIGYEPIFDPSPEAVADLVLPHYIDATLYSKLIESELSEQSSRRNAMETATDSADKIKDSLKIVYNKARQGAITQEITEVVSGANAGKDDDD